MNLRTVTAWQGTLATGLRDSGFDSLPRCTVARTGRRSDDRGGTRLDTDIDASTLHGDDSGRATLWQRVTDWLAGDAPASRPLSRASLASVRGALAEALADIQTLDGERMALRVASASTLDDLWMLRIRLFDLVAHVHSQGEAQRRLARLDPHFAPAQRRRRTLRG